MSFNTCTDSLNHNHNQDTEVSHHPTNLSELLLCSHILPLPLATNDLFSVTILLSFQEYQLGASLVVQWLRIRLPMQGTWVRALVWEDPTCRGATKPVHHN